MKLSISDIVALSLAVAAPASAAIVARVEGEITNAPGTRTGTVLIWFPTRALADRAPIVSVIDDWCRAGKTTGPSPSISVVKPSTANVATTRKVESLQVKSA
ncbi:hypothetical protein B0H13DRAFT_1864100 [Mycena leptocephala]|nr:hypothetical protein B0H13DRAFT_1864100 [Mycena leptocephala]